MCVVIVFGFVLFFLSSFLTACDRVSLGLQAFFVFVFVVVVVVFWGDRVFFSSSVCVCVCCLLYTSPSSRDFCRSRMPSSA